MALDYFQGYCFCMGKFMLAKSDGTTILEHIDDCLNVFGELRKALPSLSEIAEMNDFWDVLFIAVYFHDFGKAHKEFQKKLKNEKNDWNFQRHEIYSVPFVDKVITEKKEIIKRIVLMHHKSSDELVKKFKDKNVLEFEYKNYWKDKREYHPEDFHKNLTIDIDFAEIKNLISKFAQYVQKYQLYARIADEKIKLLEINHPVEEIAKPLLVQYFSNKEYLQNLFLWGALKICDHFGSGKVKNIKLLKRENFDFLEILHHELFKENKDFYSHQKKCFSINGSCILIAPTGSGKTESAIGWIKNQILKREGRVYYILPYTASINAMHKRLSKDMDKSDNLEISKVIGIQHGNLPQYLSEYFDQTDNKSENTIRNEKIKKVINQYKNMITPVTICTPFQILKYLYGIRGFEKGLTFLAGAKLIFDEIHAYDAVTFAQIIVMLEFVSKNLKCDIMIMTATLPEFLIKELKESAGIQSIILADKAMKNKLKRHKIIIYEGDIFQYIDKVLKLILVGKRVIVVCNTVQNAQKVFLEIIKSDIVENNEIVLLHGRFNQRDRNEKENVIFNEKTKLLVGTQAIEVSLDIDYDVMYTEPAPLDALLQRFGRVNRKAKKDPCPIFVCSKGGDYDHYIYSEKIVERSLTELKQVDLLSENDIYKMLNNVYPDWEEDERKKFEETKKLFENSLTELQPYSEHTESEEEFYEMFTNIKVLPARYYSRYKSFIEDFNFIEAEKLLVSIHRNMYMRLKSADRIEIRYIDFENNNEILKRQTVYVAKCKYDSEIGLTDEFEEIVDEDSFI